MTLTICDVLGSRLKFPRITYFRLCSKQLEGDVRSSRRIQKLKREIHAGTWSRKRPLFNLGIADLDFSLVKALTTFRCARGLSRDSRHGIGSPSAPSSTTNKTYAPTPPTKCIKIAKPAQYGAPRDIGNLLLPRSKPKRCTYVWDLGCQVLPVVVSLAPACPLRLLWGY